MSASSSRSSSPEPLPKVYFDPSLGKEPFEEGKSEIAGVLQDRIETATAPEVAWVANDAAKAGVATKIAGVLSAGPKIIGPARGAATTSAKASVDLTRSETLSSKSADLPGSTQKTEASKVMIPKVSAPTPKKTATIPIQTQALSSKSADLPEFTQKNETPRFATPKEPAHTPKGADMTPAQPEIPATSTESGTTELSARVVKLTTSDAADAVEPKEAKPFKFVLPNLDDDHSTRKTTLDPNPDENNKKPTSEQPGGKLLNPVSRPSATNTISKDLISEGFLTHKPCPARAPPNPKLASKNPFHNDRMTLSIAAKNIVAYFTEAQKWLTYWLNTVSPSELAEISHLRVESNVSQICAHFVWTAEFLEGGREGWTITRLPDEFFQDVMPLVGMVESLLEVLAGWEGCEGFMGRALGDVRRVKELLEGIRGRRVEEGKAKWLAGEKGEKGWEG